ncbi:MAG: hypothetical protein ABFS56_27270 [Pseudomonadota bacterium]
MITIQVIRNSTGEPASNERVSLTFDGPLRGVMPAVMTNDNGEAYFDSKPGNGKVNINGNAKYKGHLNGHVVVYI